MSQEPEPSPQTTLNCPNCGAALTVGALEADTLIVCPACFTEFEPPQAGETKPKPIKYMPRRRGALKQDVPAREEVAPEAAEPDPESAEKRPVRRLPVTPKSDPLDPVKVQAATTMEDYHRAHTSQAVLKLVILALVLIGSSLVVWALMYRAQERERQGGETVKAAPAEPAGVVEPPRPAEKPASGGNGGLNTLATPPKPVEAAPALTNSQKEALFAADTAARALAAPTWQELLNYVRAPQAVKPLMRDYYARHGAFRPEKVTGLLSAQAGTTEDGRELAYVSLQMQDFREQRVILEKGQGGAYRLDWESLVGYQPVTWEDFLKKKPRMESEFRVGVQLLERAPSSVPSLPGVEEPLDNYFIFGLKAGTFGDLTVAYMRNTTPGAAELYARLQSGERFDAILKLKFAEVPEVGEIVEITELVQYGWMKGYGGAAPDGKPVKLAPKDAF
jgi:hypothetical protein